MLTSSPWGIPRPALADPAATDQVVDAIKHHHGTIQAQNLTWKRARPRNKHHLAPISAGRYFAVMSVYEGRWQGHPVARTGTKCTQGNSSVSHDHDLELQKPRWFLG
jgi:hypothetical protein